MARTNYFKRQEDNRGENWIQSMRPEDIQYSAKSLFKEMIKGNIDYQKYSMYFLDPKFMDNLIINAENEYSANSLIYNALVYYINICPLPEVNVQITHHDALVKIYSAIYQRLKMVKETSNVGYLMDVSGVLYQYHKHLI